MPADGTAVLRGRASDPQEDSAANGPTTDAHTAPGGSFRDEQGPSNHQAAAVGHFDDHANAGRRTRSHRHAEPQGNVEPHALRQHQGRRSTRLQVKDEQKQEEAPPQASPTLPRNAAADRDSRALARASRQPMDPQSGSDANVASPKHESSEEDVGAEHAGRSTALANARQTRAQQRLSMPQSSRHSTPEPPERFSDVHNTGHALRRSTRQHARSPSVLGPPAVQIERPESASQAGSSSIRVTLRPSRQAHRQQQVTDQALHDLQSPTGRPSLRSGLRSRQ